MLHPGHIHFLRAARELGDELVVIVANDATVRRMKREPIVSAAVRAEMVASLKPVDQAIVGREGNMLDIVVEEIKPHIIALGYDQDMFESKALEAKLAERGPDAALGWCQVLPDRPPSRGGASPVLCGRRAAVPCDAGYAGPAGLVAFSMGPPVVGSELACTIKGRT